MVYSELARKLALMSSLLDIKLNDVVKVISKQQLWTLNGRDKNTIARRISGADTCPEHEKQQLVEAFLLVLERKIQIKHKHEIFQQSIVSFCRTLDINLIGAAFKLGLHIPVPDIVLHSVFHGDSNIGASYQGSYVILRHDKDRDGVETPYLQACATIMPDEKGMLVYQDEWISSKGVRQEYIGSVFFVARIVNIIGESRSTELSKRSEIWWCGLEGKITAGQASLWGYVSDINSLGGPYTDRIVMIQVNEKEVDRIKEQAEYYVSKDQLEMIAGPHLSGFLQGWEKNDVHFRF